MPESPAMQNHHRAPSPALTKVIKPLRWWFFLALFSLIAFLLPPVIWSNISNLPAWQTPPASEQVLSIGKQSALVLAVYGIKPLYMLLTLIAAGLTWGEKGSAWITLRASLIAFWLGEFFCWLNILFADDKNLFYEYLHSMFMVFFLGLLFFSIMQIVDKRLLHFTDAQGRCSLIGICKFCMKTQPDSTGKCLLNRFFKWMIPLAAVVALMPLMAAPLNFSFVTRVFGIERTLNHLMPIQWYELRFSPIASIGLMLAGWLVLIWPAKTLSNVLNHISISKVLISAAAGFMGFSVMRLAFAAFYRQSMVWFIGWEELTEFLLIFGILVVLWLIQPEKLDRWKVRLKKLLT